MNIKQVECSYENNNRISAQDKDYEYASRFLLTDYDFLAVIECESGLIHVLCKDENDNEICPKEGCLYAVYCRSVMKHGVSEDYSKLRKQCVRNALKTSETYTCVCRWNEDDKKFYKEWKYVYSDESCKYILFSGRDVTEQISARNEHQRSLSAALEDAERSKEAKSEFLSRMSHNLRNPLNIITGFISLMSEEKIEESFRSNLEKMDAAAKYLLSIVNNALDMNHIERNMVTLKPEYIEPQKLFDGILDMIKKEVGRKNIKLCLKYPKTELRPILADAFRLRQIFSNILENAVNYTPKNGRIDIELSVERIGGNRAKATVIVRDSGIGMDENYLPHLYETFSYEKKDTALHFGGSGLGMSIVKNLLELMNGHITVKNSEDEGTEVTVSLEIDYAETENQHSQANECADENILQGKYILLCEDHQVNTEISRNLLERHGCIVKTAKDGKMGLRLFENSPDGFFDAVLMDVRMPEMNGIETTKAIRSLKRADAAEIPIIAMAANSFDEDFESSLNAGMNERITKPIKPQVLYDILTKLIIKRRRER